MADTDTKGRLKSRQAMTAVNMQGPGYCTIEDAVAYLSISRRTVYRLIEDGELHLFRPRGRKHIARLAKSEVRALMEATI